MNTPTSGYCEKCNTKIMVTGPNGNLDVIGCGCALPSVPYTNPVNPTTNPFPWTITPTLPEIESRKAAEALQKALNEEAEQEAEMAELRQRISKLEKTVALMQIDALTRKMKKAKPNKKEKKVKAFKKKSRLLKD